METIDCSKYVMDPLKLVRLLWPKTRLYREEEEILYSVRDNDETVVVAGNKLGKDFTSALVVLWFFLSRHPARVLTTSANYDQLNGVLWGEMRRFITTSVHPLDSQQGGPLVVNHLHLRKIVRGEICGISEVVGRVSKKGEGYLGRHTTTSSEDIKYDDKGFVMKDDIPRTLFFADEASGVPDEAYDAASTWASRVLIVGNPWPCNNFFKRKVQLGSVEK